MPITNISYDDDEGMATITGGAAGGISFRASVLDEHRHKDNLRIELSGFNGGAYSIEDAMAAIQVIAKAIRMVIDEKAKPRKVKSKKHLSESIHSCDNCAHNTSTRCTATICKWVPKKTRTPKLGMPEYLKTCSNCGRMNGGLCNAVDVCKWVRRKPKAIAKPKAAKIPKNCDTCGYCNGYECGYNDLGCEWIPKV